MMMLFAYKSNNDKRKQEWDSKDVLMSNPPVLSTPHVLPGLLSQGHYWGTPPSDKAVHKILDHKGQRQIFY